VTSPPSRYPVPNPPPDEGEQHICRIASAWIPLLIGQLDSLRDERRWINPPDDIIPQIDHLIYQIETEYSAVQIFPKYYTHLHINSKVDNGNAIANIINTGQELNVLWRQSTAALNDNFYFEVLLDAGDYVVEMVHAKSSGSGILTFSVTGDANQYVIDLYNATTLLNRIDTFTVTLLTPGLKRITGNVGSKNASSSGYVANISYFSIKPA